MTITREELINENSELQSLLAEAKETLAAIQKGDVDAIVVSGNEGSQVYSISSAETPYRTFIEEMNEGAVTLSREGIIIYCNQRFADFVSKPIEGVIGSYFKHFIAPDDKSKLEKSLADHTDNKNDVLIISLTNSLYLKLSVKLLPAYLQGDYCVMVATDITEIKKEEQKLFELSGSLKKKVDIIQRLRMQLIDKKIDAEAEIGKLKKANKKLVKEIAKHKLVETSLKQKLKQKKATS